MKAPKGSPMASSRQHLLAAAFPGASLLVGDRPIPATLTHVDGGGARVACATRLPIGAAVTLRHAGADAIPAEVVAIEQAGMLLRFAPGERAVGFALAVLATRAVSTAIPPKPMPVGR
jgi:hypothetical protein